MNKVIDVPFGGHSTGSPILAKYEEQTHQDKKLSGRKIHVEDVCTIVFSLRVVINWLMQRLGLSVQLTTNVTQFKRRVP